MSHPENRRILAVCLDCGDTLIDEATEEKNEHEVSLRADLIPGADTLLHELKRLGYPLALVADGPADTFKNNLGPYGLYDLFDVYAISEEVGVSKPDRKMFDVALSQLDIAEDAYGQVIMVGNNLSRDIRGANHLGMISVWLDWAPRRSKIPADSTEAPDYTIKMPMELLPILKKLETTEA
jgi:HAD superfamily hydrolase (TIGR01549 family)